MTTLLDRTLRQYVRGPADPLDFEFKFGRITPAQKAAGERLRSIWEDRADFSAMSYHCAPGAHDAARSSDARVERIARRIDDHDQILDEAMRTLGRERFAIMKHILTRYETLTECAIYFGHGTPKRHLAQFIDKWRHDLDLVLVFVFNGEP